MRGRYNARTLVAVTAALAAVLAGCGDNGDDGGENGNGNGDGSVTLRFSWWGGDTRHEATEQIIDAFEAQHENITIQPDYTDWSSYWDRLATATAGDDAPDIMTQEERYMTDYALNGRLLDLNTVSGSLDLSGIDEGATVGGQFEGAQYGVATGVNAFTVVADPEIFDEVGVEMPDDTAWTWQDYVDIAGEIAAGSDYYGAQALGTNEAGFNVFARQRGEALYNADGSLGFTAQTLADWWTVFLDQIDNGGAPEASLTQEIGTTGPDESLLATNQGAMGFWWTNQLGGLSDSAGRELVLLRTPGESTGQRGMYYKPAMYYSISADTEHPEEAAMFVDFLLNSDEAIDIMLTDRGLPANLEQRERIIPDLPDVEQSVFAFMDDVSDELGDPTPPPPDGSSEIPDLLALHWEEVLFEQVTPLEGAEQFMQEAEQATSR